MAGHSVRRPGASRWVPSRPTLGTLRDAVQECRGCELYADATQAVMGDGPADAALMVVGEQPGDKEDVAGEPFVGPAGRLLDQALENAGIDPSSVFRTNAVKHFHFRTDAPRRKQRIHKTPSRPHVKACGPWLAAELEVVRPRGVALLGATAGQAVYGPSFRVGTSRGQQLSWPEQVVTGAPEWVVPTVHPSSILRSRQHHEDMEAFVADLRVVAGLLA